MATALQPRPPGDGANAPTVTIDNSHPPRLQPPSQRHSEVLGCLYGQPRFRQSQDQGGRTQPRPVTPAPKLRLRADIALILPAVHRD